MQVTVKGLHKLDRSLVVDGPQADDLCFGASHGKGVANAVNTRADVDRADATGAGRSNCKHRTFKVKPDDLCIGQDTVIRIKWSNGVVLGHGQIQSLSMLNNAGQSEWLASYVLNLTLSEVPLMLPQ